MYFLKAPATGGAPLNACIHAPGWRKSLALLCVLLWADFIVVYSCSIAGMCHCCVDIALGYFVVHVQQCMLWWVWLQVHDQGF